MNTNNEKFYYTLVQSNNMPEITQQQISNVSISFNPDDDKFYIIDHANDEFKTVATGKSWRNIVYRANVYLKCGK